MCNNCTVESRCAVWQHVSHLPIYLKNNFWCTWVGANSEKSYEVLVSPRKERQKLVKMSTLSLSFCNSLDEGHPPTYSYPLKVTFVLPQVLLTSLSLATAKYNRTIPARHSYKCLSMPYYGCNRTEARKAFFHWWLSFSIGHVVVIVVKAVDISRL